MPYNIPDAEAIPVAFDLLEHEGLCMGGSTGINVAGAMRMARDLGPGHTIVTILCDYGTRYASKLFNPDFLRSKGLPVPAGWSARAGGCLWCLPETGVKRCPFRPSLPLPIRRTIR
jgi:cysteine synthase